VFGSYFLRVHINIAPPFTLRFPNSLFLT
jgi:hypothetical protein